jgi:hypothetical protein
MEDIAITDLGASGRIQFAEWRAAICESAAEVGPSLKGLFKEKQAAERPTRNREKHPFGNRAGRGRHTVFLSRLCRDRNGSTDWISEKAF